jgi:hypothetical protein
MTSQSTCTSGTTSPSRASIQFGLDEHGSKSILVYKYRSGAKSLEIKTEHDLCKELEQDPQFRYIRVNKKMIPRGHSRLDILGEDLMLPEEREWYSDMPTLKVSVANVSLPSLAKWKHLLMGSYEELYIVSHSPSPSVDNTPESSQHVSPASSFPIDSEHPLGDV